MIGGFTKFLESVDQRAAEMSSERPAEIALTNTEIVAMPHPPSLTSAGDQNIFSSTALNNTSGEGSPVPQLSHFRTASDDRKSQREQQHRDQSVQRLEHDHRIVMDQVRELSSQLQAKDVELEELQKRFMKSKESETVVQSERELLQQSESIAQDEQTQLRTMLHDLQHLYDTAQQETGIVLAQRRQLDAQIRNVQAEFDSHRAKSHQLLSERDRELDVLRNVARVSSASPNEVQDNAALCAAQRELEDMKRELVETQTTLLELQKETAKATNEASSSAVATTEAYHAARVARSMFDGEVVSHQATRTRLEAELSSKEEELLKAQKNALLIQSTSGSDVEWERRAKELGELVMEKQAAFEAKRSEADQWRTRCEAAQQRVREVELVRMSVSSTAQRVPHRSVLIDDDVGEVGRSYFFGDLARRGRWGRKAVSAAMKVDSVAMSAGRLLKRSSVLRLLFVLYIVLLQLWCFFAVTLSSVPTMSPGDVKP